eukprot:CAMPEP_0202460296 /NCGR_PEP_ID=MMETSP1360-20130828/42937_1 /ASSEMBLY_ACC=CAM_ASM_000848 /TAXON_ID=515479 /ORGANISM="Licmophora paradoxa, Strain CCMP2313" /LENGTH=267 /DNA_ID=CAMNT_0049081885 /DNA_START=36 /DNA_END=839 /DNA_ORIENTATION=-
MSSEEDFMGYVGDLTQAGTQKLGRITGEVNELVKHLKEAVAKVGKKGRVIHIAHSQGALLTSLASRQLTPLEMNQIEVIAFGGAAALKRTSLTPWGRVVNYYSINDPLLLVVPPAASALRSGFVGDDEFCFLAPRIGDPIRDHNLLGPTYAQALAWEGRRFQQTYQNVLQRMQRPLYLFLLALYHATLVRLGQAILAAIQLIAAPIQAAYWALHAQLMKLVIRPLASFIVLLARIIQEMIQKARNREQYQSAKIALEMVESNRRSRK